MRELKVNLKIESLEGCSLLVSLLCTTQVRNAQIHEQHSYNKYEVYALSKYSHSLNELSNAEVLDGKTRTSLLKAFRLS